MPSTVTPASRARGPRAIACNGAACATALLVLSLLACNTDGLTAREHAALAGFLLGPLPPSPTNAVADDPRAALLGQQLFFDARLSGPLLIGDDGLNGGLGPTGTPGLVSCTSCHDLQRGGADTRSRPRATSLGAGWTGRNAPTIYNLPYLDPVMHWDGHKDSLWSTNIDPFEAPPAHNITRLEVVHTVARLYKAPYEALFGPLPALSNFARFPARGQPGDPAFDSMTEADREAANRVFANLGKALEAYERLLIDRDTPLERLLLGDPLALTPAALRGAKLFVGKAACDECHRGPLLSDLRFHNDGVPQVGPLVPLVDEGRAGGIPALLADEFNGAGPYADAYRPEALTGLHVTPQDLGAFRTASLRGIGKTAPYMHTGAVATLWDVVSLYRQSANTDGFVGTRDPAVQPLPLTDEDVSDLVAFLDSLDGAPLPAQLLTQPVLP